MSIHSSMSEPNLVCPITLEVMRDPVVAADGHTYEREAILKWFGSGSNKSPSTGARLASTALIPNHRLRTIIDESGLSPSASSSSLGRSVSSGYLARVASSLRGVRSASSMLSTSESHERLIRRGTEDTLDDAEALKDAMEAEEEDDEELESTPSFPQLQPHLRELVRTTTFFNEYLEQREQLESVLLFLYDAQMPLPPSLRTESMLLRLGSALLSASRGISARGVFEEAAALPGASYVPRIWLCVSHVINGEYAVATRLLRQLLVEVPESSPEYSLLQGLLATTSEDDDSAATHYAEGIARGHAVHRSLSVTAPADEKSAVVSDPALRHYRTENLAWLYHLYSVETKDDDVALEGIVGAQQLGFPRKVTLFRNMALTLMRLGRYDEALANINWSLELNDTEPLSWEHKATILKRLGRTNEAVECWTRVIQLKPGCAEPLVTRATVWADPHRGIQDCLRAIQVDPDSLYARAMLVALLLDTQQFREANDFASQFIESRQIPAGAMLTPNDVHLRRGRMHARLFLGDMPGAAEDLDELHRRGHVTAEAYGQQRALLETLAGLLGPTSALPPAGKAALRLVLGTGNQGLWMTSIPPGLDWADEATGIAIALVFFIAKKRPDIEALVSARTRMAPLVTNLLASSTTGRVSVRDMLVRLSPVLL